MINVFQPSLGAEELEAVRKVFESNWIGKGEVTDRFENSFADYIGVERRLMRTVDCCTEGLFLAMQLLGIAPGDEVILPSISFVGTGNAVLSCGGRAVFCDVDKRSLNTTAAFIKEKITRKTKAVIVLHYGGLSCDMDEICGLLKQKGIALIEDSACSVASRYAQRACGTFGDIGVWSFDAMKILSTGTGGMLYCQDPDMAQRAEEMLYLGLKTKSGLSSKLATRWWKLEVSYPGRRSNMNDISSAIGLKQLKKLPGFIARRKEIHETYNRALAGNSWLRLPPEIPQNAQSSHYFYWVQLSPGLRDKLAEYLRKDNIYSTFRYYPLHLVKIYDSFVSLPNAEEAAETTLCIPIHQSLSEEDVNRVIQSIIKFGKTHS